MKKRDHPRLPIDARSGEGSKHYGEELQKRDNYMVLKGWCPVRATHLRSLS